MSGEKEWLTGKELAEQTGYLAESIQNLVKDGTIPPEKVCKTNKRRLLYHKSVVPELKERYEKYEESKGEEPPKDAIDYDGYLLTPEMIRELEAVRNRNGYRAIHWTNKTVEQLIAMGGDKKENR